MSNIPFLDRTTHDTFRLRYVFNSSEPSDNVNPLHVSDQILNTANKWSKKSEFMLFRFFQASFAGSRPIRRGPDSFALASFTPSYGPIRCHPRSKRFGARKTNGEIFFAISNPPSLFHVFLPAPFTFLSSPILDSIVLVQEITIKIQELTHRKDIYETKNLALRCRGREKERKRERRKLMEMTREQRKGPVGIQKTKEASFRGVEESTGRGEGQN